MTGDGRPPSGPGLTVVRAGARTTVQDLGRPGYAHLGVPHSGAADPVSLRLANRLVGNPEDAAGLETTLVAENWSGPLEVRSALDGRVTNAGVERYRALDGRHLVPVEVGEAADDTIWLQVATRTSRVAIAQAARDRLSELLGQVPDQGGPAERRLLVTEAAHRIKDE